MTAQRPAEARRRRASRRRSGAALLSGLLRRECAEVEPRPDCGQTALVDRDQRALHAGTVTGCVDSLDARAHPVIEATTAPPRSSSSSTTQPARRSSSTDGRNPYRDRACRRDSLLGAGDHAPGAVDGGVRRPTPRGPRPRPRYDDPAVAHGIRARRSSAGNRWHPAAGRGCPGGLQRSQRHQPARDAGRPRLAYERRRWRRSGAAAQGTRVRPGRCRRTRPARPAAPSAT